MATMIKVDVELLEKEADNEFEDDVVQYTEGRINLDTVQIYYRSPSDPAILCVCTDDGFLRIKATLEFMDHAMSLAGHTTLGEN